MPDPDLIAATIADGVARERGSVTGTEREAARRAAHLTLELVNAEQVEGRRASIPSWYCPDRVGLDECRRSAWLAADRTHVAQVVHHHAWDDLCEGRCELLAMGGAVVPYASEMASQPTG